MKKRKKISYQMARVVLSDTLPYEIPIIFSNRHFYSYLIDRKVSIPSPIKALLTNIKITIPFNYKIAHKKDDFRELSLIHPNDQTKMIQFYEQYKDLIIYYCNVSPFSIRKPVKTATLIYYDDCTHKKSLAHTEEHEVIEEDSKEYENLKTFFVYQDYSNIHKFYESYKYHRCEKKYDHLFKFDLSKCFDSIYTHSITWAQFNKKIIKESAETIRASGDTFSGKFDQIMQSMNHQETNGIVIGPEFSRIFAEVILQKIDLNVFLELEKKPILHEVDYEVFRYVDDYFIFYNKDVHLEEIFKTFRLEMSKFKFSVNDKKTETFSKPMITDITVVKQKISDLFESEFSFETSEDEDVYDKIYVSSDKLITQFKIILKESQVSYKDILNYTLAILDRRVKKLLKHHANYKEDAFVKSLIQILDFAFFIYASAPRVNSTIKICMILSKINKFLSKIDTINNDNNHLIKKKISDEISFILKKNISAEYVQIETLYLLITLRELGPEYLLDTKSLAFYFRGTDSIDSEEVTFGIDLNYFSIVVLMFYIKNKKRYKDIRIGLQRHIIKKFEGKSKVEIEQSTELVLLFLDMMTCPFVSKYFKKRLLELYGISNGSEQNRIIKFRKFWFIKWTNFDLERELNTKKGREVY